MITTFLAQIDNPVVSGFVGKEQGDAGTIFGKFIISIVGVLLILGSLWAMFQLLLGGLDWISSGGDKGKLEGAQGRIRNAVIGLVILFASWAVFLLIMQFLGISPTGSSSFQFTLPSLF